MAKDPAVLFYCGDFLNGCADLTMEERGQYITLLCLQHQKGHLSEKTICLSVGSVSVDVLAKFQKDEAGLFFHDRMDLEIEKRAKYCNSRKMNGLSGGRPKKEETIEKPYAKPYENHIRNRNRNENRNININEKGADAEIFTAEVWPTFDDFWNAYDKKVDKPKVEKLWQKLSQSEKEQIMQHVPEYVQSQPDKQYRKNPQTYLNSKSYENEIISKNTGGSSTATGFARDLADHIHQQYGNS